MGCKPKSKEMQRPLRNQSGQEDLRSLSSVESIIFVFFGPLPNFLFHLDWILYVQVTANQSVFVGTVTNFFGEWALLFSSGFSQAVSHNCNSTLLTVCTYSDGAWHSWLIKDILRPHHTVHYHMCGHPWHSLQHGKIKTHGGSDVFPSTQQGWIKWCLWRHLHPLLTHRVAKVK